MRTSVVVPPVMAPLLDLIRRFARTRRTGTSALLWSNEPGLERRYTSAETSVDLLLGYVFAGLEPTAATSQTVALEEELDCSLQLLTVLLDASYPHDQAIPRIRFASTLACTVSPATARAVAQIVMGVCASAIQHAALFLTVSVRSDATTHAGIIEIEADLSAQQAMLAAEHVPPLTDLWHQLMGGTITITAHPWAGSALTLSFPLESPSESPAADTPSALTRAVPDQC